MAPRRSHKKSRAGCRRCKLRKIKCDEVHPRCGNCVKHGVTCDFATPEAADNFLSPSTPSVTMASTSAASSPLPGSPGLDSRGAPATTPTVSAAVPTHSSELINIRPSFTPISVSLNGSQPASPQARLLELRLLHHYTTLTSKTLLFNSPAAQDVWGDATLNLAFKGASYLADAVLAIAALHLRSHDPTDKAVVRACHAYMASSLSEYCHVLNAGLDQSNAEAMFLTSTLIAFQSSATRLFLREDAEMNASGTDGAGAGYTLPIAWFHAFRGVKAVIASSWQWIRTSQPVLAIIDAQPALQLDLGAASTFSFFSHLLEDLDEELETEDPLLVESTRDAYTHAVSVIDWAHRSPHPGAATAFPATVAKRYIDLVELRRPRALAILASFFALLRRVEDVWWLKGVPRREIMGIIDLFERGSPWWRHLEWPLRIAMFEGTPIPPDVWGASWEFGDGSLLGENGRQPNFVEHIEMVSRMMALPQQLQGMAYTPPSIEELQTL